MKRTTSYPYYSYLIRLWPGDEAQWHATLQDVHTGDRHAFGDLADLFAFLAQQAELPEESDPTDAHS